MLSWMARVRVCGKDNNKKRENKFACGLLHKDTHTRTLTTGREVLRSATDV